MPTMTIIDKGGEGCVSNYAKYANYTKSLFEGNGGWEKGGV